VRALTIPEISSAKNNHQPPANKSADQLWQILSHAIKLQFSWRSAAAGIFIAI
jgi:hypothetical protein